MKGFDEFVPLVRNFGVGFALNQRGGVGIQCQDSAAAVYPRRIKRQAVRLQAADKMGVLVA